MPLRNHLVQPGVHANHDAVRQFAGVYRFGTVSSRHQRVAAGIAVNVTRDDHDDRETAASANPSVVVFSKVVQRR